jgi:hypothetical protein
MSDDSEPPVWGPAPIEERDLETLLSGARLGAVTAALRAAPAPAELDREAAARAAFRMFLGDGASDPVPLPALRSRRRIPRLGRGPLTALLSGAAAVSVGLIALVFALSGGGGSGTPGQQLRDTHAVTGPGGSGQQGVDGKASATPTAQRPKPAASAPAAARAARSRCPRSYTFGRGCTPSPGAGGGAGSSGGHGGFGSPGFGAGGGFGPLGGFGAVGFGAGGGRSGHPAAGPP